MSQTQELTSSERDAAIRRLADRIGCGWNPHVIMDLLLTKLTGVPTVNPMFLEMWLVKTGKYHPEMCDESLRECMIRHYGAEWADLAESLI